MYHGREEQQTDAKTTYRRQYVKTCKDKRNTKTKKQQTKTRQPYENVGREPQKSSQGPEGGSRLSSRFGKELASQTPNAI